jgi:CheY-like chemotaxis protein
VRLGEPQKVAGVALVLVRGEIRFMAGRKILVVEDDATVALHLSSLLREEGYAVVGPESSVAMALTDIADNPIDAALLDVNLGGDERVFEVADVLAALRKPFVFVSAYSRNLMPPKYRARPHVNKPFAGRDLLGVLAEAIARPLG